MYHKDSFSSTVKSSYCRFCIPTKQTRYLVLFDFYSIYPKYVMEHFNLKCCTVFYEKIVSLNL